MSSRSVIRPPAMTGILPSARCAVSPWASGREELNKIRMKPIWIVSGCFEGHGINGEEKTHDSEHPSSLCLSYQRRFCGYIPSAAVVLWIKLTANSLLPESPEIGSRWTITVLPASFSRPTIPEILQISHTGQIQSGFRSRNGPQSLFVLYGGDYGTILKLFHQ